MASILQTHILIYYYHPNPKHITLKPYPTSLSLLVTTSILFRIHIWNENSHSNSYRLFQYHASSINPALPRTSTSQPPRTQQNTNRTYNNHSGPEIAVRRPPLSLHSSTTHDAPHPTSFCTQHFSTITALTTVLHITLPNHLQGFPSSHSPHPCDKTFA